MSFVAHRRVIATVNTHMIEGAAKYWALTRSIVPLKANAALALPTVGLHCRVAL